MIQFLVDQAEIKYLIEMASIDSANNKHLQTLVSFFQVFYKPSLFFNSLLLQTWFSC